MSIINTGIAKSIFLFVLAGSSAQSFAGDGVIRFSGAVVEPACSVQGTSSAIDVKSTRLQAPARNIELAVRCNTVQSVQISFEEPRTVIEEIAAGNGHIAEMVLSNANQTIRSGDSIHYIFASKQDIAIPLTASMRQENGADKPAMRKNILVSFDYQ